MPHLVAVDTCLIYQLYDTDPLLIQSLKALIKASRVLLIPYGLTKIQWIPSLAIFIAQVIYFPKQPLSIALPTKHTHIHI